MVYKNPEDKKIYMKSYHQDNKEKHNIFMKLYRIKIRKKVIDLLGGKCIQCGESDWRCLQVDHIEGKGSEERRKLGSTLALYRKVLSNPKGYQCLCANCNWKKKFDNNEY